jgi:hypothetical protein
MDGCRIFIDQGKGSKDRYILFPASFQLVLKSHLLASPQNRYLFETRHCGPFTPRRVQQIVQEYRRRAGLDQRVHPNLFRHQMLSHLTPQGLSDSEIQLIPGHESKRSLEVYQHLSLEQVERAYQAAVISTSEHELARRAAAPEATPASSRRLSILTHREIDDLYGLPRFTEVDRQLYFDLSAAEEARVRAMHTNSAKAHFLLQLGYLKSQAPIFLLTPMARCRRTCDTSSNDISPAGP